MKPEPKGKSKERGPAKTLADIVLLQARSMIFSDPRGTDMIVKKLKEASTATEGIAHTAAMTMKSIDGGFKQKGQKIPGRIMAAVFCEVVGDLTEIAAANGMIHPDDKKEVAKDAIHMGSKVYKSPPPKEQQAAPPAPGQAAAAPAAAPPPQPGLIAGAQPGAQP